MSGSLMGHDDRDLDRWIEEITDAWRLPPRPRGQAIWSERVAGLERQPPGVGRLLAGAAAVTVLGIAAVLVYTFAFAPVPLGGPGSSPQPSPPLVGGADGMARDELFELTVAVHKSRYAPEEPISISTTLRYAGAAEETLVTSSGGGIVGFLIEQVDGPFDPGGGRTFDCHQYRFQRGDVENVPFRKSGGYSASDPMADFWVSFYADPELRLPVGTYRISAEAIYGPPECGSVQTLTASVQVVVSDPTSASEAGAWGQARDGLFELTIESDKARYAPEEPIGISTTLRYLGPASEAPVTTFGGGLAAFGIEQLDGPIDADPVRRPSSLELTFRPGYVASILFVKPRGFSLDDPMAQFWQAFLADPELRLPAGIYRISAEAAYQVDDGGSGGAAERMLVPSILVTVG